MQSDAPRVFSGFRTCCIGREMRQLSGAEWRASAPGQATPVTCTGAVTCNRPVTRNAAVTCNDRGDPKHANFRVPHKELQLGCAR